MKKVFLAFIFMLLTVFAFSTTFAGSHKEKSMDKQQHKEMKKAAKEERKANKSHSDDDDHDDDEEDEDESYKNGYHKDKKHRDEDDDGDGYKKDHHKDKEHEEEDDDRHHGDTDGKSNKGLDKQRAKKAEQERKELGKGSEQGQASREEHSRKWWRFWE